MMLFVLNGLRHLKLEFACNFRKVGVQLGNLFRDQPFALRTEVGAMSQLSSRKQLGEPLVADALVNFFDEAEILVERAHKAGEVCTLNLAGSAP